MRFTFAAALFTLAVATGAGPASAAGLTGMGKAIFGDSAFQFHKANLAAVPVHAIGVGGLKVVLQKTRLKDIQKVYGGTIQEQGDGADQANWLCYTTDGSGGPATNVWFIANALGGHEFVMIVAAELANPKKPAADCEPASAEFVTPQFGVPGLGSGTADIKSTLGAAPVKSGKLSYRADEPGADALGTALNVQYIGYFIGKDRVTGIGVGETSAQIPQ